MDQLELYDTYKVKGYGIFGSNSRNIEAVVIGALMPLPSSTILFVPNRINIGIIVDDLNPRVFGGEGSINWLLNSYAQREHTSIGLVSRKDTGGVLQDISSRVKAAVSQDVEEILRKYGLSIDTEEYFVATGGVNLVIVYNRELDRSFINFDDSKEVWNKILPVFRDLNLM